MHIEIFDMRIKNFAVLKDYIPFCTDIDMLVLLSNELSTHIINKNILAGDANELFSLIKNRMSVLSNDSLRNNSSENVKSKRLALFKEGSFSTTSISNQEGIIFTSLLILNIILTAFMYTMLFIIRFIK